MPRNSHTNRTQEKGEPIEAEYTEKKRKPTTPLAPAEWQARFLAQYAECGSITESADFATVARRTVYDAFNNDPAFKAAYDAARKEYTELLISEINRRAVRGTEEVETTMSVNQETGAIVARERRVRKYSDTLLIFQAKAYRPELYGDRVTVNTVNVDAEIARMAEAEAVPVDIVRLEVRRMARAEIERQRAAGQLSEPTNHPYGRQG